MSLRLSCPQETLQPLLLLRPLVGTRYDTEAKARSRVSLIGVSRGRSPDRCAVATAAAEAHRRCDHFNVSATYLCGPNANDATGPTVGKTL
jgi:hypothetical protein